MPASNYPDKTTTNSTKYCKEIASRNHLEVKSDNSPPGYHLLSISLLLNSVGTSVGFSFPDILLIRLSALGRNSNLEKSQKKGDKQEHHPAEEDTVTAIIANRS
jgi:hypothetical protein